MPNKITITTYSITELEPKAQQKALDWYRERQEFWGLEGSLISTIHSECDKRGLSFEWDGIDHGFDLTYTLGFCQSDYVAFAGTVMYQGHKVKINTRGSIDFSCDDDDFDYKDFHGIYHAICKAAMRAGYDEILYQMSDEQVIEMCEANEYTFLASGARAPEGE